jgi:ClpP class serine protease
LSTLHPLIEARLQRTVWGVAPEMLHTFFAAIRRPGPMVLGVPVDAEAKMQARSTRYAAATQGGSIIMQDKPSQTEPVVAVIPVFGVVGKYLSGFDAECGGGFDLERFTRSLRAAIADPQVSAVVLHIHSPGGSVGGVREAAQLIAELKAVKPIYAYTDTETYSAAYWLAAACTAILASPMAGVASIGCYLAWIDDSAAMEAGGLKLVVIKDGDYKASTLPGQLTEEAAAMLLAEVKAFGGAFREDVVQWRREASGLDVPESAMQGQSILARDAVDLGLVDGHYRSLEDLLIDLTSTNPKGNNP